MSQRKSKKDLDAEYALFVEATRQNKHPLEIRQELGLTKVQLDGHVLRGYNRGDISKETWIPTYLVFNTKAMPETLREYLAEAFGRDIESLPLVIRADIRDGGVHLSKLGN